jgi:hypothetical protein
MKRTISLLGTLGLALAQSGINREAITGWFSGLKSDKVVYAVNCGSQEEVTDLSGITYRGVSLLDNQVG